MLVLFLLVIANYDAITKTLGIDIFYRFETLPEDSGSGRGEIYALWWQTVSSTSVLQLIFGAGYNGFINYYQSAYSAHNDFMEIFIDYGLVGLIFYVKVVWRYIKVCYKNIKSSTRFALPCITSLVAFFSISLFSHCVIYPSYFLLILLFWIYVENQTKQILH